MTVHPFKVSDYAEIEMGNGLGLENWGLAGGIFPTLQMMEKTGTYFTVRDGRKIFMIGGYFEFVKEVCEVSFYPSVDFLESPLRGYRMLKKFISSLTPRFRRLQIHCRQEDKFIMFAERLGFKQEGIMRKFSYCGKDHVMMAIVR
jgi:hypothetical protein